MRVAEFSGAHHIPSGIVSHIFGAARPASTQGEPADVADPPHPARKFAVGCSERDNLPLNVRDYTHRGGGAASTPRGADRECRSHIPGASDEPELLPAGVAALGS